MMHAAETTACKNWGIVITNGNDRNQDRQDHASDIQ